MSAPDPREVLAEAAMEHFADPMAAPGTYESLADDLFAALTAAGHLSVDGGPPADELRDGLEALLIDANGWTDHHSERVVAHVRPLLDLVRPVPAGEAGWEPEHGAGSADDRYGERPSVGTASSDGPAAPTSEVLDPCPVCGASRFDDPDYGPCAHQRSGQYPGAPVAAPATCDGSGWFPGPEGVLAKRGYSNTCPGCPRCKRCGRCGTVGGGGRVVLPCEHGDQCTAPCPSCGGTAPTEAPS